MELTPRFPPSSYSERASPIATAVPPTTAAAPTASSAQNHHWDVTDAEAFSCAGGAPVASVADSGPT